MPFYRFEAVNPNPPRVVPVIFDHPVKLPKALRDAYGDLLKNPVEWARFAAGKLEADLVYVQLISPSPEAAGRAPHEAVKLLEDVLQEVKVPVAVGAPGDPENPMLDAEVLGRVAEVTHGERCLLSYVTMDQFKLTAEAALQHGHVVVAYTPTDINLAKQLNANLLELGLETSRIVTDPTTAALGWSLEYSYSVFERIRLLALQGDELLQTPLLCAACNAWTARESYVEDTTLGPRELRGVLWEAVTAVAHIMAGADLVLMLHPEAMSLVRSHLRMLTEGKPAEINLASFLEGGE